MMPAADGSGWTRPAGPWPERLERHRHYLQACAASRLGRRLRGKVDADDLVQEAFLRAVSHLAEFRGTGDRQLRAWLRAILKSQIRRTVERFCAAAARDVRRERDPGSSIAGDQSTPSRAAVRGERAAQVAAALARLPDEYRRVLTLRNFDGLSFPDVAECMGRSVGAVTHLWTRAVRRFRELLPREP